MPYRPNFQVPTRQSLGLTTHVDYARYNPNHDASDRARKSLTDLDYSPLRRLTLPSFYMGVLISMGGFIFGYDTGKSSPLHDRLPWLNSCRSDLRFPSHAGFP